MFGSGSEQATNTILSLDPTNGNAIVGQTAIQATRSVRGVMPFAEFELGAEWGRKIGIYQLSLQTALVGQVWSAGNPANQGSIFWSAAPQQTMDYQDTLGLVGFRLAASLSY